MHLFGRPARWEELEAAVPHGVELLEDAAGALGARRGGRACGGLGRLGCVSFHPRKIVTTGEGGAVTTNDGEVADSVRRLRHHGIEPRGEFEIRAPGLNYRLPDVLCALGIPQLARLDELLSERERLSAAYAELLSGVVQVPAADEGDRHGWQAYVAGVHRLAAYANQGPFPGADECYERALALPFHNRLTERDVERVAEVLARHARGGD